MGPKRLLTRVLSWLVLVVHVRSAQQADRKELAAICEVGGIISDCDEDHLKPKVHWDVYKKNLLKCFEQTGLTLEQVKAPCMKLSEVFQLIDCRGEAYKRSTRPTLSVEAAKKVESFKVCAKTKFVAASKRGKDTEGRGSEDNG